MVPHLLRRALSTSGAAGSKHAVIVGSGVIGVTSAYRLAKDGYKVTVIDRRSSPAAEASFGNAAMINISYSRPKDMSLKEIWDGISSKDHPVHIEKSLDRHLLSWGLHFLRSTATADPVATTGKMTALGNLHVATMKKWIEEEALDFPLRERGLMQFFRTEAKLQAAVSDAKKKLTDVDYNYEVLSSAQVVEREPRLAHLQDQILGGLQFHGDITADSRDFVLKLTDVCKRKGVEFRQDTNVERLEVEAGSKGKRVAGLVLEGGEVIRGDVTVLAAGSFTTPLAHTAGVRVPIYPVRGHSITFTPEFGGSEVLSQSVGDGEKMVFYSPLPGGRLRVAAYGDFAGYNLGPKGVDNERLSKLMSSVEEVMPDALSDEHRASAIRTDRSEAEVLSGSKDPIQAWTGLRPMSADNVPIIGKCEGIEDLYVNSGHGVMGWTSCCGSAEVLAAAMNGGDVEWPVLPHVGLPSTPLSKDDYRPSRFPKWIP